MRPQWPPEIQQQGPIIIKTQFQQPAAIMLWAVWALAVLVSAVAMWAVSLRGAESPPPRRAPAPAQPVVQARVVESPAPSTMLQGSGHAISKDKLD